MSHAFTGCEIELANGNPFNPEKPDHRMIDLATIAHHLACINRYGGGACAPYTVAEHAVLVAGKLRRLGVSLGLQFAGLHHDDAEAVDGFGDIQRPAKTLLDSAYRERTMLIDRAVWRALAWRDGELPLWETAQLHDRLLKRVDRWAKRFEASHLMKSGGRGYEQDDDDLDVFVDGFAVVADDLDEIRCLGWEDARCAFLSTHFALSAEALAQWVAT